MKTTTTYHICGGIESIGQKIYNDSGALVCELIPSCGNIVSKDEYDKFILDKSDKKKREDDEAVKIKALRIEEENIKRARILEKLNLTSDELNLLLGKGIK